jgi:hypothetical protein
MYTQELLQKAHRLYEREGDYLQGLLEQDPTYQEVAELVAHLERRLMRRLSPEQAKALGAARSLLLEMTRETAFKLGYLMAHLYPLEEVYRF